MCMVERGPMRKGKALCVCGGSRQNGVKGQLKGLESTDSYKKQQQQRVSVPQSQNARDKGHTANYQVPRNNQRLLGH